MFKFRIIPWLSAASLLLLLSCGGEDETAVELPPPPPPPAQVEPEPELQPIEPVSAPVSPQVSFGSTGQSNAGSYVIQVGIQPTRNSAKKIVDKLKDSGIEAYLAEVDNPGELEGTYYRVRIGFWPTIGEAKSWAQSSLVPLGYAWWVDNKRNDAVGNPGGEDYDYGYTAPAPAPSTPAQSDWNTPPPAPAEAPPPPPAAVETPAPAATDGWGAPAAPAPPPPPTPPAPPAAPAAPAAADDDWGTPPPAPAAPSAPAVDDDWN